MDSNSVFDEEDGVAERSPNGRYIRYDETLGCGAFKVVYKGFDEIDGIEIAWNKIAVSDDVVLRDRVLSEANLAKSLKHENITRCYYSWFDQEDMSINMITELFTSGSLRHYRKKHTHVELKAIKNWARQILRGLHALHTHDPPIIHRDLKCDNVFINGNHSQVKIGDLGFATILRQGCARTVIGTPEFMAPELFEDEYNELVDVYAFGMCMLELVTCEYPYSECRNAGQIYKKVLSGVKPAALGKVKDLQVREFIEKCLVPASQRLSAFELLNDPFLMCDKSKEIICQRLPVVVPKVETPQPESRVSMDIGSDFGQLSNKSTPPSSFELSKFERGKEYRLKGERADGHSISFTLWITGSRRYTFSFVFDLQSDSALSVACELIELELDQTKFEVDDAVPVAELMDSMILEFVPTWKPSDLDGLKFSQGKPLLFDQISHGPERIEGDVCASVASSDSSMKSQVCFTDSLVTDASVSDSGMSCASSLAATVDDKDDSGLKVELEAIDSQFQQCCCQLLKEREEAVESAKKRRTSYRPMAFV